MPICAYCHQEFAGKGRRETYKGVLYRFCNDTHHRIWAHDIVVQMVATLRATRARVTCTPAEAAAWDAAHADQ